MTAFFIASFEKLAGPRVGSGNRTRNLLSQPRLSRFRRCFQTQETESGGLGPQQAEQAEKSDQPDPLVPLFKSKVKGGCWNK